MLGQFGIAKIKSLSTGEKFYVPTIGGSHLPLHFKRRSQAQTFIDDCNAKMAEQAAKNAWPQPNTEAIDASTVSDLPA